MPTKSSYTDIEIPNVDLWAFMFERKDKPFSDDQGMIVASNAFHRFHSDLLI